MTKKEIQQKIRQAVERTKKTTPLAGSMTNNVTMNFVANAQLAVGGSAAMTFLADEAIGRGKFGALYINVGTLLPDYEVSYIKAAKAMHAMDIHWVLDPVAIGSGEIRTQILTAFKDSKPTIIRGNASEVMSLAVLWGLWHRQEAVRVRGVDSMDSVDDAQEAAIALAKWTGGAVAVSGPVDLVTDGNHIAHCSGGSPLMTCITGSGCSLGGVMAIYAVVASPLVAALTGTNIYNFAGSRAAQTAKGPGSFQVDFLDALYNATPEDVANADFTWQECDK